MSPMAQLRDDGRAALDLARRRLEDAGVEGLDTEVLDTRVEAVRTEVTILADQARLLCRQIEACASRISRLHRAHENAITPLFNDDHLPDDVAYVFEIMTGFDEVEDDFERLLNWLHNTLRRYPMLP